MSKYLFIAVCFLLVGIAELHAWQIIPEDKTDGGPAQNDIKSGLAQQDDFDEAIKLRSRRLTPLPRPMKIPSCGELMARQRERRRQLAELRLAHARRVARLNDERFGREWERERVQREHMQQVTTRLAVRANMAEERRNQERGQEELRRLQSNDSPYRGP